MCPTHQPGRTQSNSDSHPSLLPRYLSASASACSNLLSRQPRLRKAAADTLRHLAEQDSEAVLAEQVEVALFAALDSETGE
jgi:hypothetical protein